MGRGDGDDIKGMVWADRSVVDRRMYADGQRVRARWICCVGQLLSNLAKLQTGAEERLEKSSWEVGKGLNIFWDLDSD